MFRRKDSEIEAAIPSVLRMMGAELGMGTPFEEVLRAAGEGNGAFHEEVRKVAREAELGAGVPAALASMAARSRSLAVKRVAGVLALCYSRGEGGEPLKRLADELARTQRAALKEHAAKASMLGLAFISAACVLPSLFLALAVVGSSFMEGAIGPGEVWLVFLGGLPLVLAAIVGLAWISTPVFARRQIDWLAGGKAAEAERFLPDALLHAASIAEGAGFSDVVASIARSEYGALSSEFGIAEKKISAGEGFGAALEGIGKRLNSAAVGRACALLSRAYETGADLGDAMREAAEDAVELLSAEKEKAALLAVQKYTLLAGVLLVPVILGMIAKAVSGLDFSSIAELGLSGGGDDVLGAGLGASRAYLLLFACFSGLFLAVQEGEPRKGVAYALVFAPVALVAFAASSGSWALI